VLKKNMALAEEKKRGAPLWHSPWDLFLISIWSIYGAMHSVRKHWHREFSGCVSCCVQLIVRPPGCGNGLFGSVGENRQFVTNVLLPSSGSRGWPVNVVSVVMWRYSNTVAQGGAVAGTKNKSNWNYFWLYSLLSVTVNVSDGMESNSRIINEC